jgi:hypothetical protein
LKSALGCVFNFKLGRFGILKIVHGKSLVYAECHVFIVMLSVVMLNVVMLNVVMLNVVMLNVVMLNVVMLNVVMLSVISPSPD